MDEQRREFNDWLRQGFGRGLSQDQDRGRKIEGLDEQISQRQAQLDQQQKELDQLVERRDAVLFEKGENGA